MTDLTFVRFAAEHFTLYGQWCDDPETSRWLGSPDTAWLHYVTTAVDSFTWMVFDGDTAIGSVQVDLFENDPTVASAAFVIAPQHRRKGYARRLSLALLARPELAGIAEYHAFIEPENIASVRAALGCGFQQTTLEPDAQGFVEFIYRIRA